MQQIHSELYTAVIHYKDLADDEKEEVFPCICYLWFTVAF